MIGVLLQKLFGFYMAVAGCGFILTLVLGGLALPFDRPARLHAKHLPVWVAVKPSAIRFVAAIIVLFALAYLLGSQSIKFIATAAACFTCGLFLAWIAVNTLRHGYFPDCGAKIGVERQVRPVRYWTTLSIFTFGSLLVFGAGAMYAMRT